jgi:glycerophosphoryl diester phosphodiesterase
MILPFDSLTHPLVIAHRGSMVLGHENTLYSFDLALAAGADVLEMDIHPSADGAIMVIHDSRIDRTSNGTGEVGSLTRAELQGLDFAWNFSIEAGSTPLRGQGITIPTLDEVLKRYPDSYFSVDIKEDDPGFATEVVGLVMKRGMRDQVILGSFFPRIVELLRAAVPPLHLAADRPQAVHLLVASMGGLAVKGDLPSAYMIPDRLGILPVATKGLIRRVHQAGRRAYFWTVDSEKTMRSLLRRGADGIISNRPDLLFAVREELRYDEGRGTDGATS